MPYIQSLNGIIIILKDFGETEKNEATFLKTSV